MRKHVSKEQIERISRGSLVAWRTSLSAIRSELRTWYPAYIYEIQKLKKNCSRQQIYKFFMKTSEFKKFLEKNLFFFIVQLVWLRLKTNVCFTRCCKKINSRQETWIVKKRFTDWHNFGEGCREKIKMTMITTDWWSVVWSVLL